MVPSDSIYVYIIDHTTKSSFSAQAYFLLPFHQVTHNNDAQWVEIIKILCYIDMTPGNPFHQHGSILFEVWLINRIHL